MQTVEMTIRVPKSYVDDAEEFEMLNPDVIALVLREELDRRIMDFVNSEIKAHRAEKRTQQEDVI
jgi:hypothetical protein